MKKYGRWAQHSIGIVMSFVVLSLSTQALGIQTDQIVVTFEPGLLVGAPTVDSGTVLARTASGEKAINYTIQFEPFADGPVPTEKTNFGSFKAMFR